MDASGYVRRERARVADLLEATGPDADTLCAGWRTRHLAAHLALRESRPDVAAGVWGGPLQGWADRVTARAADGDFAAHVEAVRTGPPTLSVFALPGAESALNLTEYVIHRQDIVRAQPEWQPEALERGLADELWGRLARPARSTFRGARVELVRSDGDASPIRIGESSPPVAVRGTALEIGVLAFGRRAVDVEVTGAADVVTAFRNRFLI